MPQGDAYGLATAPISKLTSVVDDPLKWIVLGFFFTAPAPHKTRGYSDRSNVPWGQWRPLVTLASPSIGTQLEGEGGVTWTRKSTTSAAAEARSIAKTIACRTAARCGVSARSSPKNASLSSADIAPGAAAGAAAGAGGREGRRRPGMVANSGNPPPPYSGLVTTKVAV